MHLRKHEEHVVIVEHEGELHVFGVCRLHTARKKAEAFNGTVYKVKSFDDHWRLTASPEYQAHIDDMVTRRSD